MSDLAAIFDADLGEDITVLRWTVRSFVHESVAPIAAEVDREDRFPRHLWPEMGALGLHGITVAEEHGRRHGCIPTFTSTRSIAGAPMRRRLVICRNCPAANMSVCWRGHERNPPDADRTRTSQSHCSRAN